MSHNLQTLPMEMNSSRLNSTFNSQDSPDGTLPTSPSFLAAFTSTEIESSLNLPSDDILPDLNLFDDELFSDFSDSFLDKHILNDSPFSNVSLDSIQQLLTADFSTLDDQMSSVPTEASISMNADVNPDISHLPISVANSTVSTDTMSEDSEQGQDEPNSYVLQLRTTAKWTRFGNKRVLKFSDEYHHRRLRNNDAVKKTREKAKEKEKDKLQTMNKLINDNAMLKDRLDELAKEIEKLKSHRPPRK